MPTTDPRHSTYLATDLARELEALNAAGELSDAEYSEGLELLADIEIAARELDS